MDSFPPSFFEHLEDRLNLAVYDLNQELRGAEMNIRLRELLQSREKSTPLPPVSPVAPSVSGPTLPAVKIERKTMSVTGIQSGAFQAALAKMRQDIADRQTEALGKIATAVVSGAAKMNAAVDDVVAKADKEVDAALHEFAQFTNGPEA